MVDFNVNMIEEVENFISEEQSKILINYAEKTIIENNDPNISGVSGRLVFPLVAVDDPEVSSLINNLEALVWLNTVKYNHKYFNFRVTSYEYFRDLEVVRWTGGGLQSHRDGHESIPTEEVLFRDGMATSSLIYLTDQFDGGELEFEDFNLTLKPKALSLITFPSFYAHKVNEVYMNDTNIPRYTIPFFYGYKFEPFGRTTKANVFDYEYGPKSLNKVIRT